MSDTALSLFLAYSRELERESGERYTEFAASMATHHNGEVAAFFDDMARHATEHLEEVLRLSQGRELPLIAPWDFQWPEVEAPETASYESLHYLMSLREAVELALQCERAAERFYREYAERSDDPAVQRVAAEFAGEEAEHASMLELRLQALTRKRERLREDDDPPHMPE